MPTFRKDFLVVLHSYVQQLSLLSPPSPAMHDWLSRACTCADWGKGLAWPAAYALDLGLAFCLGPWPFALEPSLVSCLGAWLSLRPRGSELGLSSYLIPPSLAWPALSPGARLGLLLLPGLKPCASWLGLTMCRGTWLGLQLGLASGL